MSNGTNDYRKEEFFKATREAGKLEGKGANVRPAWARKVIEQAADGVIDPSDSKELYIGYMQSRFDSIASSNRTGKDALDTDSKSFGVQVSKLNALVKMGARATGGDGFEPLKVVEAVGRVMTDLNKNPETAVGKSPYDAMVAVAVQQNKKERYASDLTEDEIRTILTPNATEAKSELKRLKTLSTSMGKIIEGTETNPACPSPQLEQALSAVNNRIAELESEAEQYHEDEVVQKAAAILTKRGIIPVNDMTPDTTSVEVKKAAAERLLAEPVVDETLMAAE